MKILIVESPWEHQVAEAEEDKKMFGGLGYNNVEIAMTKTAAAKKLESFAAGAVYIHHHNFDAVRYLKERHPNLKYIGKHGHCIVRISGGPTPGTMEFVMEKEYDYVPYIRGGFSTHDILREIEMSKDKKRNTT